MVDLSNNENVLGAAPSARAAVAAELANIHRYPPRQAGELLEALAAVHGVDADQVLTGNGAQHVLRVIAATFLGPGLVAAGLDPTYTGYRAATAAARAEYRDVPAVAGGYDVNAWQAAARNASLLWLCSPNNPTGRALAQADAEAILAALPRDAAAVFDATYSDFIDDPGAADGFRLLADDPRVIVVKTFSKLHGLAGLRLGYAVARPGSIAALAERIDTFPVNRLAIAAGLAALADRQHQDATCRLVLAGREQLNEGLRRLGLEVFDSQANFVTARVGPARDEILAEARRAGYLLRSMEGPWRLPDCVRVGIGRPHDNDAVLAAVATALDARAQTA